jgi:phytoene dehydrogenase-like protein
MKPDAVVVGSGPNGLAGAVTLARAGLTVLVVEAASEPGGGARTSPLTVDGFLHDDCSAVHPQALASPFFQAFGLADRVDFLNPTISFGHPLDGKDSGLVFRDVDATASGLGPDAVAWRRLFSPLAENLRAVTDLTMKPIVRVPDDISTMTQYGLRVLADAATSSRHGFRQQQARALLVGSAAHLATRLPSFAASAGGLALALQAQTRGWPIPVGGSGQITAALVDDLLAHGGELRTGHTVADLDELESPMITLLDVTPRALVAMAGAALPVHYRRALERFRYGRGSAKVDFALDGPVPWRDRALHFAGTVHLGGSATEIVAAEREVGRGHHPERPFVLVSQPSIFDRTRAPQGKHTLWAYTHVPAGSNRDVSEDLTAQIERFAPGFRDLIIHRTTRTARDLAMHNVNAIGGDFTAGEPTLGQLIRRPTIRSPWSTPLRGVYLASSSTPPGPGVHGMSGYYAAQRALADLGMPVPDLGPQMNKASEVGDDVISA